MKATPASIHIAKSHNAVPQAKTWQRVWLPLRTTKDNDNLNNIKQTNHDRQGSTGGNSTYPKGGGACSKESFVVNQTLVFQIKFCGKSPALLVAAKRYRNSFRFVSLNLRMLHHPLKQAIAVVFFASIALTSCDTEGCTDPAAGNFDPEADSDDNSCYYDAEPFLGSWIYLDSIQNNAFGFEFNEQRQMLILTSKTDRKNVKMVWTYPNAIVSDTLIAGAKPNTLTFDAQDFDDGFTFEGTFIYDEFFQRIDVNYSTVKNGAIEIHKGSAVLAD